MQMKLHKARRQKTLKKKKYFLLAPSPQVLHRLENRIYKKYFYSKPMLRIRIRIRIHMFLGLMEPDPDPVVRGMDPDPSIIKQI